MKFSNNKNKILRENKETDALHISSYTEKLFFICLYSEILKILTHYSFYSNIYVYYIQPCEFYNINNVSCI